MAKIQQTTLLSKGLGLLGPALLAGCSQLPLDGPAYREIDRGAATTLSTDRGTIVYDYALVDINTTVLDSLADIVPDSLLKTFGAPRGSAPGIRVGAGDVLQVAVFESSSGGLFVPSEAGNRLGNFVTLPNTTVGSSGSVSIPYAGEIQATGRSLPEIERQIEKKLANRAIEPQVIVTLAEQNSAAVSVVGDTLNGANKFKLTGAGERMLDVISKAGGLKYPGFELFVTLQRNDRRATVYFPRLINDPKENIYVLPGDTIYIFRQQQKYVAAGALGSVSQTSGLTGQFTFDQERLSLNEALAKAGGLQDTRANPGQVFLYRMEYREALEKMGVDLSKFGKDRRLIPTVYRASFRDPSVFFSTQKFPMRDKDVIYAANSDSTEFVKFLDYVRAITSTVSGVAVDSTTTADVFAGRHVLGTN